MRSIPQILIALSYLVVACVIVCAGQVEEGVRGHVFRSDAVGFNYSFPEKFNPKVENEIRSQDPSGREHVILALWNTPERTGVPRMAFLYDKKVRQAGLSREEMADRYLAEVRQLWVNVKGARFPAQTNLPGWIPNMAPRSLAAGYSAAL